MMYPDKMHDETRLIGKPINWDDEVDGKCTALSVQDIEDRGMNWMVSAWYPTTEELVKLNEGSPVFLWVQGLIHPVVSLSVPV
jgi:hypothetical protein